MFLYQACKHIVPEYKFGTQEFDSMRFLLLLCPIISGFPRATPVSAPASGEACCCVFRPSELKLVRIVMLKKSCAQHALVHANKQINNDT